MLWKRRPLSCEYALKAELNRHIGFIRPLPPDEHLSKKKKKKKANLPFLARCGNKTASFSSLQSAYLSTSAGCWRWGEAQRQIDGIGGGRVHYSEDMCSFRPAVNHQVAPPSPPDPPFRLYLPYVCTKPRAFPRVPSDVPRQSWSRLPRLFRPPPTRKRDY